MIAGRVLDLSDVRVESCSPREQSDLMQTRKNINVGREAYPYSTSPCRGTSISVAKMHGGDAISSPIPSKHLSDGNAQATR